MPEVSSFAVRIILIVVAVVILVVLVTQYQRKKTSVVTQEAPKRSLESFAEMTPSQVAPAPVAAPATGTGSRGAAPSGSGNDVKPSELASNEDYKAIDFETQNKIPTDCFPRDKLTVEDLLPKDAANSTWAQVMPAGQGDVQDQNFLSAGHHVGMNTVGQTLRNANYQLRSEPPNPKVQVSVWNQSTIEYDGSRKYFEVGEC